MSQIKTVAAGTSCSYRQKVLYLQAEGLAIRHINNMCTTCELAFCDKLGF